MSTARDVFAFDRASVRDFDDDGHLHVQEANLSKACVNPYRGKEIPNWQALGLDGEKIYRLLRHPDELKRAAPSFNGKPLLFAHQPLTAETHDHDGTVGSVRDVRYEHPYLKGKLDVWPGEAIDAIKSDEQKELSSAYRYDADMTPGEYEGAPYDGVMRNIRGNHVALVREGRAGPDCVVGDSMENLRSLNPMKIVLSPKAHIVQGALVGFLGPKLAQDAKIDWAPALKDVSAANFRSRKAGIAADVMRQIKGHLAQDENVALADVAKVLDAVASIGSTDPKAANPEGAQDDDREGRVRAICGNKLGDDEIAKLIELLSPAANDSARSDGGAGGTSEELESISSGAGTGGGGSASSSQGVPAGSSTAPSSLSDPQTTSAGAADEDEDDEDARRRKEKDAKEMVSKPAMDAAIKSAVSTAESNLKKTLTQTLRAIDEAREEIRPYVGTLKIAADSADDIYKACLVARNVDIKGVHPSAFRAMVRMLPKAGSEARGRDLAMDAAPSQSVTTGFFEMFPGAQHIRLG